MNVAELMKPVLQISILLIVFGLGLKANWRDAMFLFHEPGLLLRSVLAMNLIMPLTAIALIAGIPTRASLGDCPGGTVAIAGAADSTD